MLENAFMVNHWGRAMSQNHLGNMMLEIVNRSSNSSLLEKEPRLHHLRHSISTHLAERGAGLEYVRDFLGHTEMDTSHIYTIRRKKNRIFAI